jgi:hypothetical protein
MRNNMLITLWIDDDKEEEFIADIENVDAPFRKLGHTTAGTVKYQISCISVSTDTTSLEITYWTCGYLDQIGFMLDDICSFQVSSDC